jgi:hypothetical protein
MIDLKSYYRRCAVALLAGKLYTDYCFTVKNFPGFGPEMYAEQWLVNHLVTDDCSFRDEVCETFISMLLKSGKK